MGVSPNQLQKKRRLPNWLRRTSSTSHEVLVTSPDGVFNYASAILNDGLLLLEFCDAIHEGDGDRIMRCWKFMLLYFFASRHSKYALEAFHLLASVHATASPRVAHQIAWSRTISTKNCRGHNIPIDLRMEQLNRCLKDAMLGLGSNVSEKTVVQCGKSLKGLLDVCSNFENVCNVVPESVHHTKKGSQKDRDIVLEELMKLGVFDYIPSRQHCSSTFRGLSPNIYSLFD
jgi:L1 cell adhesion molecule like protein